MSVKDTKGKLRFDLIPYEGLVAMAKVREFGVQKYKEPWGWCGVKSDDFVTAAARHIMKHLDPKQSDFDDESGLPHIAHAITSLAMALAVDDYDKSKLNGE